MSDDMNAEQGDSGNRLKNTGPQEAYRDQHSPLEFAPEGSSFPQPAQTEDSTHPISRLREAISMAVRDTGGTQRTGAPGGISGTPAEGGPPPGISRREFLIGSAAVFTTAAVAVQEPRLGLLRKAWNGLFGGGKKDSAVTPPATAEPTAKATVESTQAPAKTASPSPAPTEAPNPVPEGSRGNVASVKELKIPEPQKEAINKMLENATVMTIVEKDGQDIIKAIDNSMLEHDSAYGCTDYVGTTYKCGVINDIDFKSRDEIINSLGLSITEEDRKKLIDYDPIDRESKTILEGKYQAWKTHSGNSSLTFEQFLADRGAQDFSFQRRARNVFTGKVSNVSANDKSPVVIIITDKSDPHTVNLTQAIGTDPLEANGVIGEKIWSVHPGAIGSREPKYGVREDYELDSTMAYAIAQWSDVANLLRQGEGVRSGHIAAILHVWQEINKHSIPIQHGDHWVGISNVDGIPLEDN